jgi:hypothetical protein
MDIQQSGGIMNATVAARYQEFRDIQEDEVGTNRVERHQRKM